MKNYLIVIIILVSNLLLAQINYGPLVEINPGEELIKLRLNLLEKGLNESNGKYLKSIVTKDALLNQNQLPFNLISSSNYLVEIKPEKISIEDNYAVVKCLNTIYLEENILSFSDTLILLKTDDKWIFDDLGTLTSISKKTITKINGIEAINGYT